MIFKTIIHIFSFKKLENIISKMSFQTSMQKYMGFAIKQSKKKVNKPGIPLVFIESVHVSNNSSDNLVKKLGKNDSYRLSQELNANVLSLLKKKFLFL